MLGIFFRKQIVVIVPTLILTYLFLDRQADKAQRIESSKSRVNHMIAHDISFKIDLYNQILMNEKQHAKNDSEVAQIEETRQRLYKLKVQLKSHGKEALTEVMNSLEKDFAHIGTQSPELSDQVSKLNISLKANNVDYQRHENLTKSSFHKFIAALFGITKSE